MYKLDLALNNLQWLICHKIKPYQVKHYTAWQHTNYHYTINHNKDLPPLEMCQSCNIHNVRKYGKTFDLPYRNLILQTIYFYKSYLPNPSAWAG